MIYFSVAYLVLHGTLLTRDTTHTLQLPLGLATEYEALTRMFRIFRMLLIYSLAMQLHPAGPFRTPLGPCRDLFRCLSLPD